MKGIRKIISVLLSVQAIVVLAALSVIVVSNLSPIYRFEQGSAFSGPDIYNPYARLDTLGGWTRANLHTHTHSTRWINECEFYPDSVWTFYDKLGYDLVTFSNHMELTTDPRAVDDQVWVYEHGYNFAKHHNLVFGPRKGVDYHDLFLPFTVSQKQFKMDFLRRNADFIFFNHPDRTNFTEDKDMALLTGYRLMEADCGFKESDTFCHKWDVALSNGHYVPSAISDDLHKPRETRRIGRRMSFLNCDGSSYESVKECLLSGNFYTMHVPDFGEGDWDVKTAASKSLPGIVSIGMTDSLTTYMTLSRPAATIEAIGQDGKVLKTLSDTCAVDQAFADGDSYLRYVARFDDGCVIMSNPFARWDASSNDSSATPYRDFDHPVNWPLTILFNLAVLLVTALLLFLLRVCVRECRK